MDGPSTIVVMTVRATWLDLLLREVDADELVTYGAVLASHTGEADVARVEAETRAALQLKALLQQRAQRAGELAALDSIVRRLAALHRPADLLPEIVDQAREPAAGRPRLPRPRRVRR